MGEKKPQKAHGGVGAKLPSVFKEGWPRHQKNGPIPLIGEDGVVVMNVAQLRGNS
jgi:hypothetical protein